MPTTLPPKPWKRDEGVGAPESWRQFWILTGLTAVPLVATLGVFSIAGSQQMSLAYMGDEMANVSYEAFDVPHQEPFTVARRMHVGTRHTPFSNRHVTHS